MHVVCLHGTEVAAVACMLAGLFVGAEIMQSHALGLVNDINTAAASNRKATAAGQVEHANKYSTNMSWCTLLWLKDECSVQPLRFQHTAWQDRAGQLHGASIGLWICGTYILSTA